MLVASITSGAKKKNSRKMKKRFLVAIVKFPSFFPLNLFFLPALQNGLKGDVDIFFIAFCRLPLSLDDVTPYYDVRK